ncbi:hypothetical protein [Nocardia sp. NPDC059239]|uniref:hypothetical protein n=1 Tax=Nocardia sp. NPDC059239 TaxID=3346785 RepID=UPI00369DBDA8
MGGMWSTNVTLEIGQEFTLPDTVRFTYALNEFGPERRHIDGWGVFVELPAVVELLDLVTAGELDLADVRAALARVAAGMEREDLLANEAEGGRTLPPICCDASATARAAWPTTTRSVLSTPRPPAAALAPWTRSCTRLRLLAAPCTG